MSFPKDDSEYDCKVDFCEESGDRSVWFQYDPATDTFSIMGESEGQDPETVMRLCKKHYQQMYKGDPHGPISMGAKICNDVVDNEDEDT
jgi:hypothetical protein